MRRICIARRRGCNNGSFARRPSAYSGSRFEAAARDGSQRIELELSCESEIVHIACEVRPDQATLVPERREEVTTEGGLDVVGDPDRVRRAVETLHAVHIR